VVLETLEVERITESEFRRRSKAGASSDRRQRFNDFSKSVAGQAELLKKYNSSVGDNGDHMVLCEWCAGAYTTRGLGTHKAKCKSRPAGGGPVALPAMAVLAPPAMLVPAPPLAAEFVVPQPSPALAHHITPSVVPIPKRTRRVRQPPPTFYG
jgi:hypothetical protein